MWYDRGHESIDLHSTPHRELKEPAPSGPAFIGCVCLTSLLDPVSKRAWAASPSNRLPTGLRRPDRSRCRGLRNEFGLCGFGKVAERPAGVIR